MDKTPRSMRTRLVWTLRYWKKYYIIFLLNRLHWWIQDFPEVGAPTPKLGVLTYYFAKNCIKIKEFGPRGGTCTPGTPFDPPMDLQQQKNLYVLSVQLPTSLVYPKERGLYGCALPTRSNFFHSHAVFGKNLSK